jgi:transcriptional regulator with PAS, ATPase and Fis domain
VALNCAAIPSNLLESELFGYKQGAFTDAHADKKGLVEAANNGTMFLDEISELPIQLQPKLLRLLENSEYMPVGDVKVHKAEVRFIAATNVDLMKRIKDGQFREDLYYRLNVITIHVPPLRERKDDIPILAEYFLNKYSCQLKKDIKGFTERARNQLQNYHWNGNIREMENVIQAAVALTSNTEIDDDDLQLLQTRVESSTENTTDKFKDGFKLDTEIERIEKGYLSSALDKSGGNHTQAAKLLGMSLSSFRYKAQKYGLI